MVVAGKHAFARTAVDCCYSFCYSFASTVLVVPLEADLAATFVAAPVEAPMVPADFSQNFCGCTC